MQLAIDSHEALADVLRAVGGLYGVTLSVVGDEPGRPVETPPGGTGSTGRGAAGSSRGKARARAGDRVDAKAVREWAADNGLAVSSRGALSAEVRSAYADAHRT